MKIERKLPYVAITIAPIRAAPNTMQDMNLFDYASSISLTERVPDSCIHKSPLVVRLTPSIINKGKED